MSTLINPGAAPPVLFVSQRGTGGAAWQPVINQLTTRPAVFAYDRPGTGEAPGRATPNPPIPWGVFAAELLTELEQADIFEPAVLVGHSIGGLIIRAFASAYPGRVAGMVHVDGSIPRLHLWGSDDPFTDGDEPDATEIDTLVGEIEIVNSVPPPVPTVVLTRRPGRWDVPLARPEIDDLWSTYSPANAGSRWWSPTRRGIRSPGKRLPWSPTRLTPRSAR